MKITKEDVDKIANLAKLAFTEEEKESFRGNLEEIVSYVEKLNELNTDFVEPTYYIQASGNVVRKDEVKESLSQEEALANAPEKAHGLFRVPKVIQTSGGA